MFRRKGLNITALRRVVAYILVTLPLKNVKREQTVGLLNAGWPIMEIMAKTQSCLSNYLTMFRDC